LAWEIEEIRSILVHHEDMKVQDNPPNPTIMSLAEEVYGKSKVGTVKFEVLPPKLDKLHELRVRMPPASKAGQPSMSQDITLTLDDKFLGITTLYCPPPGDHKAE
jgi:protein SERAC1